MYGKGFRARALEAFGVKFRLRVWGAGSASRIMGRSKFLNNATTGISTCKPG